MSNYAEEYLAWHEKEYPSSHWRVAQIVRQHLLPVFGVFPLDAITPKMAEDYKHSRSGLSASGTVTKELRILKALLNKAVEWELLPRNRIAGVSMPQELDARPPHFYTKPQLKRLYAASPYHAAIWQLMVNTGLRRSEALQLKKADIGESSIRVLSTAEERTKSGKWREIPLTDNARRAVKRIKTEGQYVLPREHPRSLTRAFERCAHRAKLGGTLHSLRHTYISQLVMAGVPLRAVQVLAGHASVTTTEKYSHLTPEHLQLAGTKINL
jgi:integrase